MTLKQLRQRLDGKEIVGVSKTKSDALWHVSYISGKHLLYVRVPRRTALAISKEI